MAREDADPWADQRSVELGDAPRNRGRKIVEDRGVDLADPREERRRVTRGAPLGGDGAPRVTEVRAVGVE